MIIGQAFVHFDRAVLAVSWMIPLASDYIPCSTDVVLLTLPVLGVLPYSLLHLKKFGNRQPV